MLKQVGDCLDILKYINTTLERVQWLKVENICATKYVWPYTTTTDDSSKRSLCRSFEINRIFRLSHCIHRLEICRYQLITINEKKYLLASTANPHLTYPANESTKSNAKAEWGPPKKQYI